MNKTVSVLLLLIFFNIAFGLYVGLWKPALPDVQVPDTPKFYTYSGVVNVHSLLSSGSGTIDEIAAAGERAGTDFIIMTDSHNYEPDFSREGYFNKVMLLVGGEYSYLDSRLLVFDMRDTEYLQGPGRSQMNFAEILSEPLVNKDEGMFVLAHPLKPGYKLSGDAPAGLDGIEIFNLKSIWQWTWLKSKPSFFWSLLVYPYNSHLSFIRMLEDAVDGEINYWDKLLRDRRVFGFAGSDAEAKIRVFSGSLVFPSYETLFGIVKNHVLLRSELTGSFAQDRRKIVSALRAGNFYMGVDILQRPNGFYAVIEHGDGKTALPGDTVSLATHKEMDLKIHLPVKPQVPFRVNLLKDGQKLLQSESVDTSFRIYEPGTYRIEIYLKISLPFPEGRKWLPWILTNPFFVT